MLYLAEKLGSPLVPQDLSERAKMLTWLMFQMCGPCSALPGCRFAGELKVAPPFWQAGAAV